MAVLENFENAITTFNELYNSLSELSEKQEKALNAYFDSRGIPYDLRYAYIPDEGLYIFAMRYDALQRWEYYLGMEYARDAIIFLFQFEDDIIIGYHENSRASEIYEVIENNGDDEDE